MESQKKNRLKSVVILGPAYPFRGGLATVNQSLARSFIHEGIDCRIFTFTTQYPSLLFPGTTQFSSDPAPEGVDITREVSSINPLTWIRTGRKIRRARPDAVVVRYWIPVMAPAFGTICRIARCGGVRTIALLDNVIPHERRPFDKWLTRYFLRAIDGFVYMSEQVRHDLRLFTKTKPAVFSPHPMLDGYGEPLPRGEACDALGLDPALHYTMFFGYIRDYKGLDLLLDAWGMLKHQGKLEGHKLIVAGEYYSGRERYAEQINRYGIQDDLVLLDHYISDGEVAKLFSIADLVVQPYRHATQSGVTQIAYWFDVPMVVTGVGGLREIVPDGEVGYVTEPDAAAIAAGIDRFYREEKATEFRTNILQFRERFTWKRMVRNFCNLYVQIEGAQPEQKG